MHRASHSESQGFHDTLYLLSTVLIGFARVGAEHIRPPLKTAERLDMPGCGSAETPGLGLSFLDVTGCVCVGDTFDPHCGEYVGYLFKCPIFPDLHGSESCLIVSYIIGVMLMPGWGHP